MATTAAVYKGKRKTSELIEMLQARGYLDEAADPFLKWSNKRLVDALLQSDAARGGGTSGPTPLQQELRENEDYASAVQDLIPGEGSVAAEAKAAADAAASSDDSLCSSDDNNDDDDKEDAESNDDEDDMDEPTALGVMRSLGVPLDTPDGDVDLLARAKIGEAAIGVGVLAAIAESAGSGLRPATDFIYGFSKVIGSYAQGGGDVESFPSVFRALLSQAKLELQLLVAKRKETFKATSKDAKALARKMRNEMAQKEISEIWSGGQVRHKSEVLEDEPALVGMEFHSRDSCELHAGEIYESTGKLVCYSKKGLQKTASNLVIGCSDPSCSGRYHYRLTYRGPWALTHKVDCNCTGAGTVTSSTGSTAIPTRALVELVKPMVAADSTVKSKVIVAALTPYLYRPPNRSLVQRLRALALSAVVGDPLDELRKLPAFVQALKDCGHRAEIKLLTKDQFLDNFVDSARSEHKAKEKKKPKAERRPFVEADLPLPPIEDGALFVDYATFTPMHAPVIWKKIVTVSSSDFAHGKNRKESTVFGERVGQDANRNVMLLTAGIFNSNENKAAWKVLNGETNNSNSQYDAPGTMDVSDADKGASAAFPQSFKNAGQLIDLLHRKLTIAKVPTSKGGGPEAVDWFMKAHSARSMEHLEEVKRAMPVKIADLLAKIDDAMQYPIAAPDGGKNGIVSSSPSESWNHAIDKGRALPFAQAFVAMVKSESERFRQSRESAAGCEALLPPRVHQQLVGSQLAASRIDVAKVTFQDPEKTVALVPLCNDPSKMAKVNLAEAKTGGAGACDVLCMSLSKYPCPHVLAAAAAKGIGVMAIINPELTTQHWKDQYEGLEFPLPSAADVEKHSGLINMNICLPPAFKRSKGRPKSQMREKGYMEKGPAMKHKLTCSIFYFQGHTKKSCPNAAALAGPPPWGQGL